MASLTDFFQTGSGVEPLAFQYATMVPQYRVSEEAQNLQEDAAVANNRTLQDFAQRTLPQIMNQGAASGQIGSSGLNQRAQFAAEDANRNVFDVNRMLNRNLVAIAQQKVMATMGGMF